MDLSHKKLICEQLTIRTIANGLNHKPHLQTSNFNSVWFMFLKTVIENIF